MGARKLRRRSGRKGLTMEQRLSLELLMLKDLLRMQVIDQTLYEMASKRIQQGGQTETAYSTGAA